LASLHAGYGKGVSDDDVMPPVDEARVARRAHLTPEERHAGSDDPQAQARAILEDSEMRSLDRSAAPGTVVEHRRSEDTVEPPE
jgi:hypothetical protein